MGAIGEDGVRVLDRAMVVAAGVSEAEVAEVERREQEVLAARLRRYRRGRDRVDLRGRTAIVVDDGVATGSTARGRAGSPGPGCGRGGPRRSGRSAGHAPRLARGRRGRRADEPGDFRAVGFHYGTSRRRPTTRWWSCSTGHRAGCSTTTSWRTRSTATSTSSSRSTPSTCRATFTCRTRRRPWSCSPTAAAAAGTVPATAWWPTCSTTRASARSSSTCSPRPRSTTVASCSTSTSWPGAWWRPPLGARAARGPGGADRLLRGEHRGRRRPRGGGEPRSGGLGGGLAGWSPRPRAAPPARGDRADTVDRGK